MRVLVGVTTCTAPLVAPVSSVPKILMTLPTAPAERPGLNLDPISWYSPKRLTNFNGRVGK
jgi:hypothetical protein